MVRPMSEWRFDGADKLGELAAFLDQVDELLGTSDGQKDGLQSAKQTQSMVFVIVSMHYNIVTF